MWIEHGATVFGMILCADKPFESGHFYNLDKVGFGVFAHALHAVGFKHLAILVVELEAVAMALAHIECALSLCRDATLGEVALIGSKAHCSAKVADALLLLH